MHARSVQVAARRLLSAHDHLLATRDTLDTEAADADVLVWRQWYFETYRPAYATWDTAMRAFATAYGDESLSRQPEDFRPLCDYILGN